MTTEYVYLSQKLHRQGSTGLDKDTLVWSKETVNTLYVTENRKLVGVLSLLDIVTADDNDKNRGHNGGQRYFR